MQQTKHKSEIKCGKWTAVFVCM